MISSSAIIVESFCSKIFTEIMFLGKTYGYLLTSAIILKIFSLSISTILVSEISSINFAFDI